MFTVPAGVARTGEKSAPENEYDASHCWWGGGDEKINKIGRTTRLRIRLLTVGARKETNQKVVSYG